MNNQFIPYELALKLKELGFDGECIKGFYEGEPIYTIVSTPVDFNNKKQLGELVSAPLWQQAFNWFREKCDLFGWIDNNDNTYRYNIKIKESILGLQGFKTYEEARLECLKKLIEIVKNK